MGSWGMAVSGMNCPKCGALLPAEAAYCPSCGTPRSEIDHLMRQAERAVNRALVVGTTVLDRAAKELQPTFDKAVQTLRPAAEASVRTAKEVVDKTVAAVRPAVTKATEKTGSAVHKIREKVRSR